MSRFTPAEEQTLIARMRAGDAPAFERVITTYYPELLAYLTHHTGSVAVAEDVMQDVFFRLWRARERIIVTHGLTAYLYSAMRNQLLNHARTEHRSARAADRLAHEGDMAVHISADVMGTEQEALLVAAREAIDHLPARAREVWQLHRERGLTYTEVAAVMGISVNTVKSQLARAVGLLRTALEPLLALLVLTHR